MLTRMCKTITEIDRRNMINLAFNLTIRIISKVLHATFSYIHFDLMYALMLFPHRIILEKYEYITT